MSVAVLPVLLSMLASAPEVALLSTPGDGDSTELRFQRAGAELSPAVARFTHGPRSTVLGALLPGTRTVLAIAQTFDAKDPSWAATLVRLEPGKEPVTLVERVAHSTRPLVTRDGRVFVQRGREGEGRVDAITIDEVNPRSGAARTIHSFSGYTAFLVAAYEGELIAYRVGPAGADLVAIHRDALGVRVLTTLAPMARDFVSDGRAVYFTTADAEGWRVARVDLRSGAFSTVARATHVAALPALLDGRLAFSPGPGEGLRFEGGALALLPHGPGFERVQHVSAGRAFVLHELPSGFPTAYVTELKTGRALELPAPKNVRLDLAGVIE